MDNSPTGKPLQLTPVTFNLNLAMLNPNLVTLNPNLVMLNPNPVMLNLNLDSLNRNPGTLNLSLVLHSNRTCPHKQWHRLLDLQVRLMSARHPLLLRLPNPP